jgi:ribosome maturation factor RimP
MFGAGVAPFCFFGQLAQAVQAVELDKKLEVIVTKELDLLGYELVKLESSLTGRRRVVRLFVDHPERDISVDDCVKISKTVGFVLDGEGVIGEQYNLEVSSPGMNRPLVRDEHFRRFTGKTAKVLASGEEGRTRTLIGRIDGVEGGELLLTVEGREERVPLASITKANLHGEKWNVPSGKKRKKNKG